MRSSTTPSLDVVVVGQTPPPYGGQAIMIETLLAGTYDGFNLHHVRMAFSKDFQEIGRFRPKKILHLLSVVLRVTWTRITRGGDVLYYPPGRDRIPLYRDIFVLLCTRWMFKSVIFHFHAAGVGSHYEELPSLVQRMFRKALFGPEVGVRLSARNEDDSSFLFAKRDMVVRNGIPDEVSPGGAHDRRADNVLNVGLLSEPKGIMDLLRAVLSIKQAGRSVTLTLVGQFESRDFERRVHAFVHDHDLDENVEIAGELSGAQKAERYRKASIFCFPSTAASESFGIVLLEAMQHGLPIVAYDWKAAPEIVVDGETGIVCRPGDVGGLADAILRLVEDPTLARQLGSKGRARYEQEYTVEAFHRRMSNVFAAAAEAARGK